MKENNKGDLSRPVTQNKVTKTFSSSTNKVLNILLSGGRYSVIQLTQLARVPDPRSCIREARNAGMPISDIWIKTDSSRYKVYFICQD